MSRHHVIISGTGRAGTTFLVQLLTALKLDTGYYNPTSFIAPKRWNGRLNLKRKVDPKCNAGLELDIRQADAPYIIKSPFLCDDLDELVEGDEIVIDHTIIPMRDLYSAAESRRAVDRDTRTAPDEKVAGGLMNTKAPEEQESTLARMVHNLFFVIAKHDIPVTLLHFPRLVHNPEYLYKKLGFLFPDMAYDAFLQCFLDMSRTGELAIMSCAVFRAPAAMAAPWVSTNRSFTNWWMCWPNDGRRVPGGPRQGKIAWKKSSSARRPLTRPWTGVFSYLTIIANTWPLSHSQKPGSGGPCGRRFCLQTLR